MFDYIKVFADSLAQPWQRLILGGLLVKQIPFGLSELSLTGTFFKTCAVECYYRIQARVFKSADLIKLVLIPRPHLQ